MQVEILLVVFVSIAALQAATVKPTHEPNEFETLSFLYNRNTQNLLMRRSDRQSIECYVQSLTDAQKAQVHTDNGLKTLELSLIGKADTASAVSIGMIDESDVHYCTHGSHNRTISYFSL